MTERNTDHLDEREPYTMRITRRFTKQGQSPYEQFEYTKRASVLRNPDGRPIFEMTDIEVPKQWSQVATDILAQSSTARTFLPSWRTFFGRLKRN